MDEFDDQELDDLLSELDNKDAADLKRKIENGEVELSDVIEQLANGTYSD